LINSEKYFIDEDENGLGRCLVLKASWSDRFIELIEQENISVLRLSYSAGWKETDISFLEKLVGKGLRGVEIYAWGVKDVTPLQHLANLEHIGLQCEFTKAPDFSNFKNLINIFLSWRPKAKTIFDCLRVEQLNIVNYPSANLNDLKGMSYLKRLQLTSRKLVTLEGIEALQSLEVLDLFSCTKLESFDGIAKCSKLKEVELESCKKINDISSLGGIEKLRKVILTDCGKIKSLCSLVNCSLLETLTFTGDTNIEDGKLTPLLDNPKLKRIWFADKTHYSHNRDEIAATLSLK
jgi:hypothetical protein